MIELAEEWLSVSEISRLSNISEPSVRRYLKLFSEHFEMHEEFDRKKYRHDAIETLIMIADLYQRKRMTTKQIKLHLDEQSQFVFPAEAKNKEVATLEQVDQLRDDIALQFENIENKIDMKTSTVNESIRTLNQLLIDLNQNLESILSVINQANENSGKKRGLFK